MDISNLEHACELVIKECKNQYAVSYASAILNGEVQRRAKLIPGSEDNALKDQANYILANIQGWRGDTAKAVRKFLKEYVGD